MIKGSQTAALITWIWPKNERFAFGDALFLWVMVGFWSVWGNLALNAKIAEIVQPMGLRQVSRTNPNAETKIWTLGSRTQHPKPGVIV